MRARLLPCLLLLSVACGTGLYDASGVAPLSAGNGLTCDLGQVACAGVCTQENATHCGANCSDCSATVTPPANGRAACLSGGTCGFECGDGLLKCGSACCGTTALAAGAAFSCALLDDGTVRCWGANDTGQLGDGTVIDRPAPVEAALPGAAIALGAGTGHACAILGGGSVICWGNNGKGQATGTPSATPALVPAAAPISNGATSVAAGASHTCAIVTGAVKCWGENGSGQLGGVPVSGVATPIPSGATAIAAGADHTCAIVAGAVKCWGENGSAQLGGAPVSGIATPIDSGITLLAASAGQGCASTGVSNGLGVDDVVRCWGDSIGAAFLFADPQPTPAIPMKDGSQSTLRYDVTRLAAGRKHLCVEKKAESVECFGADNASGQLGGTPIGPSEAVTVPLPVTTPALRALAAGADHTCAAVGDGRLRCWGDYQNGRLGDGLGTNPGTGTLAIPSGR